MYSTDLRDQFFSEALPLKPLLCRAGSAQSVTLAVPSAPAIAGLRISAVKVTLTLPSGSVVSAEAVALPGTPLWTATFPASAFATAGKVVEGFEVALGGKDERGTSRIWIVAKGDLEVKSGDATPTPGESYYLVKLRDSAPTNPVEGDSYISGGTLNIYHGNAWIVIGADKLDSSAVCFAWDATYAELGGYVAGAFVTYGGRIWHLDDEYTGEEHDPPGAQGAGWQEITVEELLAAKQAALAQSNYATTQYPTPKQTLLRAMNPHVGATIGGVGYTLPQSEKVADQLLLKANATDLPYALVTLTVGSGEWTFAGNGLPDAIKADLSMSYDSSEDQEWELYFRGSLVKVEDGSGGNPDALSATFSNVSIDGSVYAEITATRPYASNGATLLDRASNKIVPTVVSSQEWVWSDGETGTPQYANGYWTVRNASFQYDGPVAGSSTDTEITFPLTGTQSFYFAYSDWDYETGGDVFVFNVGGDGGEEVRAAAEYDEDYMESVVRRVEYNGVEYVFEYPVGQSEQGSTYTGTGAIAEHVVTLSATYGPTLTLAMPPAVAGRVRDLIARIDLSQAAGAPPVAFVGGTTFEAVGGEMPELVKGVNILSFTATDPDSGVFAVSHKEMKPITNGGS